MFQWCKADTGSIAIWVDLKREDTFLIVYCLHGVHLVGHNELSMIDHPGSSSSHSAMYVAVSTGQGNCRRHPVQREVIWSTPHASIRSGLYSPLFR